MSSPSAPGADDQQHLLDLLHSYGQQFLSDFNIPSTSKNGLGKRKREEEDRGSGKLSKSHQTISEDESESEQEWGGIRDNTGSEEDESIDSESSDFEQEDDDFTADASGTSAPSVVVFSDPSVKKNFQEIQRDNSRNIFMSSKVAKISQKSPSKKPISEGLKATEDEEVSNVQNDALLYKLVHTKLLSGSLNTELEMTPAQRRTALSGRVLELAGHSALGKGERTVKNVERSQAARRVRQGLENKQKEREKQKLEEAKQLGNYHPLLKKVFDSSSGERKFHRREKGLKLGVGRYSGGILKLDRRDIAAATGSGSSSRIKKGRGSTKRYK